MAQYLDLNGASNTDAAAPDAADFDISGDLEVIAYVAATDWTPAAAKAVASRNSGGDQWYLIVNSGSTGRLQLSVKIGGSVEYISSSVGTGITDGANQWIRVTRANSSGDIKFYTGGGDLAGGPSWSQLGTTQSSTAGALTATNDPLKIGSLHWSSYWDGQIYLVEYYDGIGGTLIADFNADDFTVGDTDTDTAVGSAGNTWTIRGTGAEIKSDPAVYPPFPRRQATTVRM